MSGIIYIYAETSLTTKCFSVIFLLLKCRLFSQKSVPSVRTEKRDIHKISKKNVDSVNYQ